MGTCIKVDRRRAAHSFDPTPVSLEGRRPGYFLVGANPKTGARIADVGGQRRSKFLGSKHLIVAANRLPVTVTVDDVGFHFKASPGGLVSALSALKGEYDLTWIGWPGEVDLSVIDPAGIEEELYKEYNARPIFLTKRHLNRYYFGFSNKVLWPVLHYLPTHIDFDDRDFQVYREVNQIFADKVIEQMRGSGEDDMIWVQDYQLMLVPGMIREKMPDARIGFFLHTPFPSSEVFRALPYREELLKGLLGSSLIGFHTFSYLRHFRSALLHLLGIDSEINLVELEAHQCHLGAFPISVDTDRIEEIISSPSIEEDRQIVRNITHGRRMILSVDRLDYTKGLPDRLRAYKKFLMRNPNLVRDVVLVQIAVPSRIQISDYQDLKNQVELSVFDIIETYESEPQAPIHFIYRSLPFSRLCAFYMEAEIALVTPYFDGMNLVAKEFVCVKKEDGVLILSEHAGAAHELGEALIINPYNPDQISAALEQAMHMDLSEKQRRMSAMHAKIRRNNVHHWSNSFLHELSTRPVHNPEIGPTLLLDRDHRRELLERFASAERPAMLLDYDGTLTEITTLPLNAKPDRELLDLLQGLAALPQTDVGIVTGRSRKDITDWLGELPITFSCEHGLWIKWRDESEWHKSLPADHQFDWLETVRDLFEQYNKSTPGSFTEEKEAAIAWHYRMSDPTQGRWKARELLMNLQNVLANRPLEVAQGKMIVEVRVQGIHKGNIIHRMHELGKHPDFMLAMGDDSTDEHLFDALQDNREAYTVRIGKDISHARYRLGGVAEARQLLRDMREARLNRENIS